MNSAGWRGAGNRGVGHGVTVIAGLAVVIAVPGGLALVLGWLSYESVPILAIDAVCMLIGTWLAMRLAQSHRLNSAAVLMVCGGLAMMGFSASMLSPTAPYLAGTSWVLIVLCGLVALRWREPLNVVTLVVVCASALTLMSPHSADEFLTFTPFVAVAITMSVCVGLLGRSQLRSLLVRHRATRQTERVAMAHELHDVIAHELTGIVVLAQAAAPSASPDIAVVLEKIEGAGSRALADIRAMVSSLHTGGPSLLAPAITTRNDLLDTIASFTPTTAATVHAECDPRIQPPEVSDVTMLAVHRILTESLTNIRRHGADATVIDIAIGLDARHVVMTVQDNGTGDVPGAGPGSGEGLRGLSERARAVGGTLTAHRETPRGWVVRARLPVETPS